MPRQDHDQRFKALIQEFLKEFVRLFFPEWYERFDFNGVEWRDKEIFLDPPRGETRDLDLVAEVAVRQSVVSQRPGQAESWVVLIHIEVEADDRLTRLRPRMHDYYKGLRDRYGLPVWSLALYLHVGLEGVGWDVFEEYLWERRVLHFEYPYVGLPGLPAEHYAGGESLLGVALTAMMRVPKERRVELIAHGLQRVAGSGENEYRKSLLAGVLYDYREFDATQEQEFERLLETAPYQGVKAMTSPWHDRGEADGQRRLVRRLIETKFGPLDQRSHDRLERVNPDQLEEMAIAVLKAKSLKDLGLQD